MKYLAFDLETLGTERRTPSHIIQLSGVVEDTSNLLPLEELPHFTVFVAHDRYDGEAYALQMNHWILHEIAMYEKTSWMDDESKRYKPKYPVMKSAEWIVPFRDFLQRHFENKRITMAGKNAAGFDMSFLPPTLVKKFHAGVLDPGPLYLNMSKDDKIVSLDEISAVHGLPKVDHDAYKDNLRVIEVIRKHPRFPDFGA